jgi:hypothetical protein
MREKWVICKNKKCNRVLWEEDADKDGLCVDCRGKKPEQKEKAKVSDK